MNKYKISLMLKGEKTPTITTIEEGKNTKDAIIKTISKIEDRDILYKYLADTDLPFAIIKKMERQQKEAELERYEIIGVETNWIFTDVDDIMRLNPEL